MYRWPMRAGRPWLTVASIAAWLGVAGACVLGGWLLVGLVVLAAPWLLALVLGLAPILHGLVDPRYRALRRMMLDEMRRAGRD